jgi:GT2 family glycosyltransferase
MNDDLRTISALLVTYNSSRDIGAAIESVLVAARDAGIEAEFIVIDNASTDGSVDIVRHILPDARLIVNPANVGFGRAVNQGLAVARGAAILLLNPDARLAPDALGILDRALVSLRAAAVAPTIGTAGAESAGMAPGFRSAVGHFLGLNRLLPGDRGGAWRGIQLHRRAGKPRRVEWASAAALLVDADTMRGIGGFDERFFMYGEDVDLCLRLAQAGGGIRVVPAAHATHSIAASQGGVSTGWVDALHDLASLPESGPVHGAAFDLVMSVGLTVRAAVSAVYPSRFAALHRRRMRAAAWRAWQLTWDRRRPRRRTSA